MSKETVARIARRVLVLGATIAVIGVAAGTVQLAAQWRAESAPLDTAPVGMTTIGDDFADQTARADDLRAQMSGVAKQISGLQAALISANGSVTSNAGTATTLKGQLTGAKKKLDALQKQLKAAQARLAALNAAAARQAALNRSAAATVRTRTIVKIVTKTVTAPPPSRGGEPGDD